MQTVETVMSRRVVLSSIVHQSTESFYQAVVAIFSFTNKQEIDVSIRLDVPCLVQWVDLVGFVVAKHVDTEIIQLFNLLDFTKRCWERNSSYVHLGFVASVCADIVSICL